ncbi:hypothetical protein RJT34_30750 [Clitoria ternatea]|uniref:Uncharacterized protein n=1 Tax=Clitoria ternatea TaxID=43366 RepID=A0AAN9EV40_CLITE
MQEKIIETDSQGTATKEISPNDSLGQVLSKEHSSRGLRLGVSPSIAFDTKIPNNMPPILVKVELHLNTLAKMKCKI